MFLLVVLATFVYDVAFDIVYDIVTFADIAYDHIAIIRYCMPISYAILLLYNITRQYRKKHTMIPYNVAYDIAY